MRKLPPPPQPRLTSSPELPTYTVAGQQPHDAAPEVLRGSFPASRQETPLDSRRAPAWPQRKNLGHPPAFAIGPTAGEGKTKAASMNSGTTKQGNLKERTFKSTFVIALRRPRRTPKAGTRLSRKASSPAATANHSKGKPAKTTTNGKATLQKRLPIDAASEREHRSPQVSKPSAIRPHPRVRRPVNGKLQRPLPLNPPNHSAEPWLRQTTANHGHFLTPFRTHLQHPVAPAVEPPGDAAPVAHHNVWLPPRRVC